MRKTIRRIGFSVVLTLLVAVPILGGMEVYLRIDVGRHLDSQGSELWRTSMVRIAENPELGFEIIPCPDCPDPVNTKGFRGPEYSPRPDEGTVRIAVLGDSVAYGTNLAREQAFPAVLERALGEIAPPAKRFEVVNASTPGYNITFLEAAYRLKVRDYHASVVLYAFFTNDFDKLHVHRIEGNPPLVALIRPDYYDLPWIRYLPGRLATLLEHRSYLYNWLYARAWSRAVSRGKVDWRPDSEPWRRTEIAALDKLADDVEADGARFAIVLIPPVIVRSTDPAACAGEHVKAMQVWCEYSLQVLDLAGAVASRRNIPVIEVLPYYATHLDRDLQLPQKDPDHPNEYGHALIAQAILEHLGDLVDPDTARRAKETAATLTAERLPEPRLASDPS